KTTLECLDLDNKTPGVSKKERVAGWYQIGEDGPRRPVMRVSAPFLFALKTVHQQFPDRIWAISSESLGIYAWTKYPRPRDTNLMRRQRLNQLRGLGLPEVEVFPDPSRCLRRPFGADYRTLTPNGVLTHWADQLAWFHQPGPAPTFEQILDAIQAVLF